MPQPNPEHYRPDPAYLSLLIHRSELTQAEVGTLCGVDERTVRNWISGRVAFRYPVQYLLECWSSELTAWLRRDFP